MNRGANFFCMNRGANLLHSVIFPHFGSPSLPLSCIRQTFSREKVSFLLHQFCTLYLVVQFCISFAQFCIVLHTFAQFCTVLHTFAHRSKVGSLKSSCICTFCKCHNWHIRSTFPYLSSSARFYTINLYIACCRFSESKNGSKSVLYSLIRYIVLIWGCTLPLFFKRNNLFPVNYIHRCRFTQKWKICCTFVLF